MMSAPLHSPETPPHKQGGWVGKKNKGTHVGLRAAVRSRTRLDVRVGVSGAGTRCEAGDDAPASVGVHGLQGRELRLMQPVVFLANMCLARHSAPKTRVPARLHVSPRAPQWVGGFAVWGLGSFFIAAE